MATCGLCCPDTLQGQISSCWSSTRGKVDLHCSSIFPTKPQEPLVSICHWNRPDPDGSISFCKVAIFRMFSWFGRLEHLECLRIDWDAAMDVITYTIYPYIMTWWTSKVRAKLEILGSGRTVFLLPRYSSMRKVYLHHHLFYTVPTCSIVSRDVLGITYSMVWCMDPGED